MWTMHIQLFDFDTVNLLAPLGTNSVCGGHKSGGSGIRDTISATVGCSMAARENLKVFPTLRSWKKRKKPAYMGPSQETGFIHSLGTPREPNRRAFDFLKYCVQLWGCVCR